MKEKGYSSKKSWKEELERRALQLVHAYVRLTCFLRGDPQSLSSSPFECTFFNGAEKYFLRKEIWKLYVSTPNCIIEYRSLSLIQSECNLLSLRFILLSQSGLLSPGVNILGSYDFG
jgi:hypothetical protein